MTIAKQDQTPSTIHGQHGEILEPAQWNVEPMEFKKDSEPATHRRMVGIHVHLNNNLIAKHVTTDLAQLTVDGVIGQIGMSALSLVEEPTTPEQGYVIIQLQPMVEPIAPVMHLKWEDATKIHELHSPQPPLIGHGFS